METVVGGIRAPEFPSELEWLNVAHPLSLRRLRGKMVLLEFWTSGCINCHHNLEPTRRLQRDFERQLLVIGVHSGKFSAEKEIANLRQAVMRLGIDHPVVNDAEHQVRQAYTVHAWPTLVLIDPQGYLRAEHRGEVSFDPLADRVEVMARHFEAKGLLDTKAFVGAPEQRDEPQRQLRFPAGLTAGHDCLYVADTAHHRVLELEPQGRQGHRRRQGRRARLRRTFGDDPSDPNRFHHPHGLALDGTRLWVADTDNHAVRAIDLSSGAVSTQAGTGAIGPWPMAAGKAEADPLRTALRSPWGLHLLAPGRLAIAMAGSHQLWQLANDRLTLLAGNGRESLVDGSGAEACFSQPSGLGGAGDRIFVADPEASAIRQVSWSESGVAEVETLIGTGLFDFGDRDGVGELGQLQHAVGLAFDERRHRIYIADSFNHKIRVLDPASRRLWTLAGNGRPGLQDGPGTKASFFEPEALALGPSPNDAALQDPADPQEGVGAEILWVADTNNHCLRGIDLRTEEVFTLVIDSY